MFLAEVLEHLVLNTNPYMSPEEVSNKKDFEMTERLCRYVKWIETRKAKFGDVIKHLVNCFNNLETSLINQDDPTKLKLTLSLIGLTGCITSGNVITKLNLDTWQTSIKQYGCFFKHMSCSSQSDFEDAFFYRESLKLNETWFKQTMQHSLEKGEVTSLVECCERWTQLFLPDLPHLLVKQWKEQLADVALLSASEGKVFSNSAESKPVELPNVNFALKVLENVDSVLPKYDCAEVIALANGIRKIKLDVERMVERSYQPSLKKLKVKTSVAIVDQKLPKHQGRLRG